MNKIVQKPQLHIQYKTLNKAQTDSFRHEMVMKTSQYLNNETSSFNRDSNIFSEDSKEKNIFIKKGALERTVSVYQWRYKTCYPVVKPIKITVKSFTGNIQQKKTLCRKNSQSPFEIWDLDQNIFELIVHTQKIRCRLNQLGSLSLPQLFHLLKQILVGFQCLIDIFGFFEPTEQMVVVNEQNQWRFWISEDFASNSKKQSKITEPQFVLKIIKMAQSRLHTSKVGMKFFDDLKDLPVRSLTFLNLLEKANIFISSNKIMVAKKYVSSNNNSLHSLHGSKNLIYFGLNKTYNELSQSPKLINDEKCSINDEKCSNIQMLSHLQQSYQMEQNNGQSKINSMNTFNEGTFDNKQFNKQNKHILQIDPKKQRESKAHMKISQFYCAVTPTQNNIQKRASFLFDYSQNIKQEHKQGNIGISNFVSHFHKLPVQTRNIIQDIIESQNKGLTEKNICAPSLFGGRKRKLSFQSPKDKFRNTTKSIKHQTATVINTRKQRKNSYYDYERPVNKQAFSQSPNKSNKNIFINQKQQTKPTKRNHNVLMQRQPVNRSRIHSQHIPRIRVLDQFAKKNNKMCQSTLIQTGQKNRIVKYGDLKTKDIACHTRNATTSGVAFGQNPGRNVDAGFNNINNDIYNGKFEQIIKSIKGKSIQGKDEKKEYLNFDVSTLPAKRERTTSAFEMIRQCQQRKSSFCAQDPIEQQNRAIVRVSNVKNQTASTLNKSELQVVRGSQQSNSISQKEVRESDSSNSKSPCLFVNRRGMIGESNLSAFSCKTYQPVKVQNQRIAKEQCKARLMAISQDFFNKNGSQSSGEFLKLNNWNKNISGLFNDVASIKMLKESNHFGDQSEIFEKQHLKDVKLEKLDKLGKQLKYSIIQNDDGHQYPNLPTRGTNNKSFSLIGQVMQEPYQNDPSYLEYSTAMIYQARQQQDRGNNRNVYALLQGNLQTQLQSNLESCQSFGQLEVSNEFNSQSELQKIAHGQ